MDKDRSQPLVSILINAFNSEAFIKEAIDSALAQAIARRIQTITGILAQIWDDPAYGVDVRDYLNDTTTATSSAAVSARVESECLRDERVQSASCGAVIFNGTMTLTIGLVDAQGPFTMVLSVSAVTVAVLQVQQ